MSKPKRQQLEDEATLIRYQIEQVKENPDAVSYLMARLKVVKEQIETEGT